MNPDWDDLTVPLRRRPAAFDLTRVRAPRWHDDLARVLLLEPAQRGQRARLGFETIENASREARVRIRALQNYLAGLPRSPLAQARRAATIDMIGRLQAALVGREQASFANPLFEREFRRHMLGEVLHQVHADPNDIRYYTIASGSWRYHPRRTLCHEPYSLREALRTHLNRTGHIADLSGWSAAFFHDEFDRGLDQYQPHFHVITKGEKYLAFEALHKLPLFKGGGTPYRPIQCDPLGNAVRQTGYLHKPYCLAKHSVPNIGKPGRRRTGKPHRLPPPLLATWLLAMDRMSFADLVWLNGIALVDGRLVPSADA